MVSHKIGDGPKPFDGIIIVTKVANYGEGSNLILFAILWLILWGAAAYWAFKGPRRRRLLGSVLVGFALLGSVGGLAASNSGPTVKTKTVQVGTHRLAKAQAESRRLAVLVSQQKTASQKLDDQSSSLVAASSRAVSQQVASSHAAAKQAAKAAAASQRASHAQTSSATQTSRTQRTTSHHTTKGDVTTGRAGKIIGNKNSKIYHVPGQAGYHMSSSNAVYFQTEAQAKAAGYRKALR